MWLPKSIVEYLQASKSVVDDLKAELTVIKAERDTLKLQSVIDKTNFDWLRAKVNQLEMERAGLIERAYQIKLPAIPELIRTPSEPFTPPEFGFDDIGDELAKAIGLPTHADR